jgi:hypothetical protein
MLWFALDLLWNTKKIWSESSFGPVTGPSILPTLFHARNSTIWLGLPNPCTSINLLWCLYCKCWNCKSLCFQSPKFRKPLLHNAFHVHCMDHLQEMISFEVSGLQEEIWPYMHNSKLQESIWWTYMNFENILQIDKSPGFIANSRLWLWGTCKKHLQVFSWRLQHLAYQFSL